MRQISLNDITVSIVTYKSSNVLLNCLNGLKKFKNVLIADNSYDIILKKKIQKKFKRVNFFLLKKNNGYASGHNFLLKKIKTKYALILNPDCMLGRASITKIINFLRSNNDNNFGILGTTKEAKIKKRISSRVFECNYVKGFLMLIDMTACKKINYFDNNFFLYLEEIDFCMRIKKAGYKVYALDNLNFDHKGERSSSDRKEFIALRNWHWMWSQYYFDKKHKGSIYSLIKFFPKLIGLFFKKKFYKNNVYLLRYNGLFSSILKKKSNYRYYDCNNSK